MTVSVKKQTIPNLRNPDYYCNRELSWLQFNDRVLHEAFDERTPLLERLKFLAIFSTNLDEFFMVRVSGLLEQAQANITKTPADGLTPQQQLERIHSHLLPVVQRQHEYFLGEMRSQMANEGIHLLTYDRLSKEQKSHLAKLFDSRIFPILTPLGVDPAHPFPRMSNLSLNIAAEIEDPKNQERRFARIKVPNNLPRFISLPDELTTVNGESVHWVGVALEDIIIHHLEALFPGMTILSSHLFRITRDADFPVREAEADDLLLAIQQEISRRRLEGSVVRLEVASTFPQELQDSLIQEFKISPTDIYQVDGLLNLQDLFFFLSISRPDIKDSPWVAVIPPRLKPIHEVDVEEALDLPDTHPDIFSIIRDGDLMLHHPYEAFDASVQTLITQAAHDPQVQAIKMTLYRTSGDSPIVNALIEAARNGKQVAVLVELKARFDEENNIEWARRLEQSGIHVVYGVLGLKTHTKTALVVREEGDELRRYVHIGTGNYNPKTAKLYTDLGLMSCQETLGADLSDLFNYLTGFCHQKAYRKLLVAPVTLRDRMIGLIQREIDHCLEGRPGKIIAKMNSLVDPEMTRWLYKASQAGVQIDLIIRGICCLKPGIPEVSKNIRVISIIGRFLEHSRIFYFQNNHQEEVYIGSADWMPRNLDRRVEAVTPIEESSLVDELKELLAIFMADNRQAWEMQSDGSYAQRHPHSDEPERSSHQQLMQRATARMS
ncbi:polyphosphate kinase 1 [Leptolyngbyaceae cyanobacterium CCMR0082]|uniref:Polyphosphate kinase n=2 Tax=Adonisia turfae TaxID=2950184 RepID=A0A6M0S0M1_9CYAN|nr:polyphosphate kinase 1 [Adonisia turfae]MDV3350920.1 polyphosphate kinase 1 [Leptothoe sp. LEGE 181152]NEZ60371.1 polyphosphate kinase 1 [Adonisia turfae CCMR0081]NEZ61936.1 polyphosphate kinase 1 [Adonisia turfae CCMR0082]